MCAELPSVDGPGTIGIPRAALAVCASGHEMSQDKEWPNEAQRADAARSRAAPLGQPGMVTNAGGDTAMSMIG